MKLQVTVMAVQDYKSLKLVIHVHSSSETKAQIGFLINDFPLSFMIKKNFKDNNIIVTFLLTETLKFQNTGYLYE